MITGCRSLATYYGFAGALWPFVWNRTSLPISRRDTRQPEAAVLRGFDGAVNGEQSLAKRTLEDARKANTLNGLGLVRAFRGQHPSPSGGEDFTARRGNARVGARPKG
jgi:hypothetical protein